MSAPRTPTAAFVLAITLALAGCGGDAPTAESTGGDSASATASPSGSPTDAASGPVRPEGAKIVEGTGYSFALPRGWADLTRKMRRDQPSLDVAVGSTVQSDGFASNLAVTVTPTGETGSDAIDDVAEQVLARVRENAPQYRIHPHTTVAGVPAAHLSGMYNPGNQRYWLEQFVVVGSEQTIVISFSLPPRSSAEERARLIDSVLKSWMIDT